MSEIAKGRGVRVEIGYTESAEKTVVGVTKDNPALVNIATHGLAFGSVGYFMDIEGMDQLDGQAVRIKDPGSPDTSYFLAEDIDSTNFATFSSGIFVPIATWRTLSQSTQYQLGGGAPRTEDVGTLIDTIDKLETIKLAAETVTIDVRSFTEDNEAMAKIRSVARGLGRLVFRITHPPETGFSVGAQRLFYGQPSIPGESLGQGGTGTGQLTVTVRGQICYLPQLV